MIDTATSDRLIAALVRVRDGLSGEDRDLLTEAILVIQGHTAVGHKRTCAVCGDGVAQVSAEDAEWFDTVHRFRHRTEKP